MAKSSLREPCSRVWRAVTAHGMSAAAPFVCAVAGSIAAGLAHEALADPAASTSKAPSAAAQPTQQQAADTKTSGRTGVRIELKIPQVPGLSRNAAPKSESKSWPKTLDEVEAEKAAKSKPPQQWSPQEVAVNRARCDAVLKRIHAVAIPQDPIKEGICGTPAPVQLISVGQNPQVALSPPAVVNCDFAEALSEWVEKDLQPLARKHVGGHVIKIEVMSSYSCRNAYGRAGNKLSEHALANALDIRGFVTSSGQTAYVLEDWGITQREIAQRVAAEKSKAAKELAAQQAAEAAAQAAQASPGSKVTSTPPTATGSSVGAPAAGIARSTISEGLPKITVTIPGGSGRTADNDAVREGFAISPSRLGGPKADRNAGDRKETFLHQAHASACQRFGTTLGPEANAAHRNHLHVDMASRKTDTKICD